MEIGTYQRSVIDGLQVESASALQPGDLLFFLKESGLQKLFWAASDIWIHVAIVIDRDGQLCTAEAGTRSQIFSRPLDEVISTYDVAAFGRPDIGDECRRAAHDWAESLVGARQEYAWDDFLLAGLVSLTRKGLPSSILADLGDVLGDVAKHREDVARQSRTCSGFVHEAFSRQEEPCRLPVEMTDTSGFGSRECAHSYADLLAATPDRQDAMLADTALYELMAAGLDAEGLEYMHGSHVSVEQLGEVAGTVFDLVDRYLHRTPDESLGEVPGRWVSPTDLWRSDRLRHRARLRRPDEPRGR